MSLRNLQDPLQTPPTGAVTLGVARHLTPCYPDPMLLAYHRDRAELIHDFVSSISINVIDWGNTDHENPPNEIVEIVIPITTALIGAGATIIASWIGRPRKEEGDKRTILGVALRRSDGTQIEFDYRTPEDLEKVVPAIRQLLSEQTPQ